MAENPRCKVPQQHLLQMPRQVPGNDVAATTSTAAAAVASPPPQLYGFGDPCPYCQHLVAHHDRESEKSEAQPRAAMPKGSDSHTKTHDLAYREAVAKQQAQSDLHVETSTKNARKNGPMVAMFTQTVTKEARLAMQPGLSTQDKVLVMTTASSFSVGSAEERLLVQGKMEAKLAEWFVAYPGQIDLNWFLEWKRTSAFDIIVPDPLQADSHKPNAFDIYVQKLAELLQEKVNLRAKDATPRDLVDAINELAKTVQDVARNPATDALARSSLNIFAIKMHSLAKLVLVGQNTYGLEDETLKPLVLQLVSKTKLQMSAQGMQACPAFLVGDADHSLACLQFSSSQMLQEASQLMKGKNKEPKNTKRKSEDDDEEDSGPSGKTNGQPTRSKQEKKPKTAGNNQQWLEENKNKLLRTGVKLVDNLNISKNGLDKAVPHTDVPPGLPDDKDGRSNWQKCSSFWSKKGTGSSDNCQLGDKCPRLHVCPSCFHAKLKKYEECLHVPTPSCK